MGIDRAREFIKHGVIRVRVFVSQEGVLWIIHIGLVLAAGFEDQFFISFFVGVLIDQPNDSCSLILVAALTLLSRGITAYPADTFNWFERVLLTGFPDSPQSSDSSHFPPSFLANVPPQATESVPLSRGNDRNDTPLVEFCCRTTTTGDRPPCDCFQKSFAIGPPISQNVHRFVLHRIEKERPIARATARPASCVRLNPPSSARVNPA